MRVENNVLPVAFLKTAGLTANALSQRNALASDPSGAGDAVRFGSRRLGAAALLTAMALGGTPTMAQPPAGKEKTTMPAGKANPPVMPGKAEPVKVTAARFDELLADIQKHTENKERFSKLERAQFEARLLPGKYYIPMLPFVDQLTDALEKAPIADEVQLEKVSRMIRRNLMGDVARFEVPSEGFFTHVWSPSQQRQDIVGYLASSSRAARALAVNLQDPDALANSKLSPAKKLALKQQHTDYAMAELIKYDAFPNSIVRKTAATELGKALFSPHNTKSLDTLHAALVRFDPLAEILDTVPNRVIVHALSDHAGDMVEVSKKGLAEMSAEVKKGATGNASLIANTPEQIATIEKFLMDRRGAFTTLPQKNSSPGELTAFALLPKTGVTLHGLEEKARRLVTPPKQ